MHVVLLPCNLWNDSSVYCKLIEYCHDHAIGGLFIISCTDVSLEISTTESAETTEATTSTTSGDHMLDALDAHLLAVFSLYKF